GIAQLSSGNGKCKKDKSLDEEGRELFVPRPSGPTLAHYPSVSEKDTMILWALEMPKRREECSDKPLQKAIG
ncbi:13260_t:CDS:2, partial [Acaulospora colombiana]